MNSFLNKWKINISTYFLLRITDRRYAIDFLKKGTLKFGLPSTWINYGVTGRGDDLEGVFHGQRVLSNNGILYYQERKKVNKKYLNGNLYKYSKHILNLPTLCFYGINSNHFTYKYDTRLERGARYGKVKLNYFEELRDYKSKEQIESMDNMLQPVVIFIKNTKELKNRIITKLINMGFKSDEIICGPVSYIDKKSDFYISDAFPLELMYKDLRYKEQSEIRFIINSNNSRLLYELKKQNYIIDFGPMDDIADIYEMYYFDMDMVLNEKNEFVFKLPTATVIPIEELSKMELISWIYWAYRNKLPQGPLSDAEIIKLCDDYNKILKEKYKVYFDYKNDHIYDFND